VASFLEMATFTAAGAGLRVSLKFFFELDINLGQRVIKFMTSFRWKGKNLLKAQIVEEFFFATGGSP